MQPILLFEPALLKSAILLLPLIGIGIAFLLDKPKYFEAVGIMLAILLNIAYLLLFNIFAEYIGWWKYYPSANNYYNIPIEIVLGWSFFWGGFLPYVFRSMNVVMPLCFVLMVDLWSMPTLTSIFILGDNWLIGEAVLLTSCLLPSLLIFKFTANRKQVLSRALIQSFIWGGWIVFLIPSVALFVEGKSIFDIFHMSTIRIAVFLSAMIISMTLGYMAVFEFVRMGEGTPIPFDPPHKLVTSSIYAYVANPLQISTLLIFVCLMLMYQSWMMIYPIIVLLIYSEGFVRWHHSVDIDKRFGNQWRDYRKYVKNWLPNTKAYSK